MDSDSRKKELVTVAQLADFDEIIDARSESEFAEDHVPGAVNFPVLNDEERARVGTLYKQVSPFDAKKLGAAIVSRNIARHLQAEFMQRPRTWRPLIYCWRGGTRSDSMAHVFRQIGWRAGRLDGGYKSYRRAVIADLETLPRRFRWNVICGLTGSGKSRLLRALAARGAQVLDLEALAAHRGSVLGNLPDEPQPSQKMFESRIWSALRAFDPDIPVFVESESKKIGNLRVPQALIDAMWKSNCLNLTAAIELRVDMLIDEYRHYVEDTAALGNQLDCLTAHYGSEQIAEWKKLAGLGEWRALVGELLVKHYDPAYTRSTLKHYPQLAMRPAYVISENSDSDFARVAAQCIADSTKRPRAR